MSKKTLPEQFRRNTAVSLILCLFVLLWLPTFDYFFHLDHAPMSNENRALAKFPLLTATLTSVHDFPGGLEAYFRDHFGFRNRLIRWERRWKHDLFKEQVSSIVLTGREGWLFFSGDHMMEHYQGLRKFTPEDLNNWQALVEKRRDWAAQRGIKYLFVITPDKQSVYPEFLPEWLADLRATNKVDQFLAHMKAHSTVEVLDMRPVLINAKKDAITYLQLDTHWNTFGGFVAYQGLVNKLAKQLPDLLPPLLLTNFDQAPLKQIGGDLTRLLSEPHPRNEPNALSFTPRPPLTAVTITEPAERLPKKWLPRTDPKLTVYENATGKAILFRDSFAGNWYAFLGYHFHEVVYIWQYEWDPGFIEREKPSVVIDETLERFFDNADPVKLMQKDALQ